MVGLVVALVAGPAPRRADALDTPNTLMGIDGMTINHNGLFRNNTPNDGFNTFVFFAASHQPGHTGRYESFYLYDQNVDANDPNNFGGISHNARYHSDSPEIFNATQFQALPVDMSKDLYPIIDRGAYGQVFDPAEYQIEVKFKPILAADPFPLKNDAHTFNILLDQIDGYVFDAEAGIYKRAAEEVGYQIGTEAVGINDWYATAAKDADGFATYTVPLSTPAYNSRSFYHVFGDNSFRDANVVTGGGRMQNPDFTWSDVSDGLDTLSFGGGPTDPNRPNSQLKVPNGVPLMGFRTQANGPDETRQFSAEFRSIQLKRITPNSIMARIDSNSGLTFRFGDGLSYATVAEGTNNTVTPINTPAGSFVPNYTDQISRFDQNGMTNLKIQPRSGPDPNLGYRLFVRNSPGDEAFNGSTATMSIRAKLTEPLTNAGVAQNMTVYARDLDGSDTNSVTTVGPISIPADPVGADDYSFNLALNQFNTSTFTTINVPLTSFTLNNLPFGFTNPGDGLLTNFNLYEFGINVPDGGGLLRLELEYMQITLPPASDADFNNDGIVDGADVAIWQRGFGGAGTPTTGDADGNGIVNAADLAIVKSKFGGPPATAAAGAVPEPASAALVAVGMVLCGLRRRSK
jgi:hypothetical protein